MRQQQPSRAPRIPALRVTFVNRFYRPDISATSQMLTQLAEYLADCGFDVEVITGGAAYTGGESTTASELLNGVQVRRIGGGPVYRDRLFLRSLAAGTMVWRLAWTASRRAHAGDVVVCLTDPPLLGAVVWAATRVRRPIIVQWLQDVFPEIAVTILPGWFGLVATILRPVRDFALRRSAAVVIGEHMLQYVKSRTHPHSVALIPNWADDDTLTPLFSPIDGRRRQGHYQGTRLVVGYQGNLGRAHDAEAMLAAMVELSQRPDIRFVLTGGGIGFDLLRNAIKRRNLTNVELRPYVSPDSLNLNLCIPDVHIISLKPSAEGFVVPSKLYSALAAGRGVVFLGQPDGEVARVLERAHAGVTIVPGGGSKLSQVLVDLVDHPNRVIDWGANGRQYLRSNLSRRHAFEAWSNYLSNLGPSKPVRPQRST